jgi:hypothetical protein
LVKQAGRAEAVGSRLTTVQMQMGTHDFISPEQIRDAHSVDIRSDIYSLGVTLYCLLAGQPPFAKRSDQEKLMAQLREAFPPLAALRPDVPPALLQVLDRMVRKNPAERYQEPAQVAEALQRFCAGEPHLLLALLAHVPAGQTAPIETRDIVQQDTNVVSAERKPSTEETMLAPQREPAVTPSARPRRRGCILAVAAAGILVVMVGTLILVAALLRKDEGTEKQADSSFPILKEDFRSTFESKQLLPKDWEGDAYRVGQDKGEPCLELSNREGVNWVTLPPMNITGDFTIAGAYFMRPSSNQHLIFRLESSKGGPGLGILITFAGNVSVNGEAPRAAPSGFVVGHDLMITRKGTQVSVKLNDAPVGGWNLDTAPDYDKVQINLSPGNWTAEGGKLYRLTIAPGAEGIQAPPAAKPGKGKKK